MLFLILSTVISFPAHQENQGFEPAILIKHTEDGYLLYDQDGPILLYRHTINSLNGDFARSNYVHPLFDLNGEALTEDFPEDHRHHRGIFWAWHQLLCDGQVAGDPWLTTDFQTDVSDVAVVHLSGSDAKGICSTVTWRSDSIKDDQGELLDLVNEKSWIIAHPRGKGFRFVDFEIHLTASSSRKIQIAGSDDDKGYGGFSVRSRLPDDARFSSKDGEVVPIRTAIKAGPWIDITGSLAGETKSPSGIAIMVHPDTAGFPQPWILRQSKSMQNPVYPGSEPIELTANKPLVLRYRLVVHDEPVSSEVINKWHEKYSSSESLRESTK